MTREETLKWIKEHRSTNMECNHDEAMRMSIKALERENVLDKIRDEIEHMACRQYEYKLMLDREDVLKVFDKYREETE